MIVGDLTTDIEDAEFPELWPEFGWCPELTGPTGLTLWGVGSRGHNGTLTNMDPATDWVRTGGILSLEFDNTDDFIEVSGLPKIVLTDAVGWTICGWFRPDTINSAWHAVMSKISGSNRQLFIGINGGYSCPTNGLTLFTNEAGNGAVGTAALTAGRTYFFCATHAGTGAGANKLAVWSQEAGWVDGAAGTAGPTATAMDADAGTNPVRIARYTNSSVFPLGGAVYDLTMFVPARHGIAGLMQSLGPGGWARRNTPTWYVPPSQLASPLLLRLQAEGLVVGKGVL